MTARSVRSFAVCALAAAAVAAAGCGDGRIKTYPVSGQVLYNGEPLRRVDVAFHAVDPKNDIGYPPHAVTDADGRFKLAGYLNDDGCPAGEFQVAIAFVAESSDDGGDQSKRLTFQLPAKYLRKETSGITVTVKPEANTLEPFRLEGPPLPARR